MKPNSYVEQRGEGWYLRGSRVSVDSLIYAFRDGLSPEAMARECFPTLTLEQVYGGITFYLANRAEVDEQLQIRQEQDAAARGAQLASNPGLAEKMARARRELLPVS